MEMSTGVITVEWFKLKDFIERYTLKGVTKYMKDSKEYLVVVPSDGYAFRSVIAIKDPACDTQKDFEAYFNIT